MNYGGMIEEITPKPPQGTAPCGVSEVSGADAKGTIHEKLEQCFHVSAGTDALPFQVHLLSPGVNDQL